MSSSSSNSDPYPPYADIGELSCIDSESESNDNDPSYDPPSEIEGEVVHAVDRAYEYDSSYEENDRKERKVKVRVLKGERKKTIRKFRDGGGMRYILYDPMDTYHDIYTKIVNVFFPS
jgi:hypothetical protein